MNSPFLIRRPDFEGPILIRGTVQNPRGSSRLAKSLGFTLFVTTLLLIMGPLRHFALERGTGKHLQELSPRELAHLDQGRRTGETTQPVETFDNNFRSKPLQKTPAGHTSVSVNVPPSPAPIAPVGRATFDVYAPSKPAEKKTTANVSTSVQVPAIRLGQRMPAAPTTQVEAPAPALAAIFSPDRHALNENLTALPSVPPMEMPHPVVARTSSEERRSATDSRPAPKSAEVSLSLGGAGSRPALASEALSADAREIIATLEKYSNAWHAKRIAEITELRPKLSRRTVKQELSSASSIVMRIQPTSVPSIRGNRATVECIHEVEQVFTDGVEKKNPGVRMTYVLVRHGSDWLIDETR